MPTKPSEEPHQSVSETYHSGFCYHIKCFDDTLYSQQPVTFVKKNYDDDVAQMLMNTFEKTSKKFIKKSVNFLKYDNNHAR